MNGELLGLPDGYRAVRFGHARLDDEYLDQSVLREWNSAAESHGYYLIVEKITLPEPPKPKTEEVVLNKYLLKQGGQWLMIVATAKYADTYCHEYTFIGHSETIEVEV